MPYDGAHEMVNDLQTNWSIIWGRGSLRTRRRCRRRRQRRRGRWGKSGSCRSCTGDWGMYRGKRQTSPVRGAVCCSGKPSLSRLASSTTKAPPRNSEFLSGSCAATGYCQVCASGTERGFHLRGIGVPWPPTKSVWTMPANVCGSLAYRLINKFECSFSTSPVIGWPPLCRSRRSLKQCRDPGS